MAPRTIVTKGKITESNKGGMKLACNGHLYRANRKVMESNKIYWKCEKGNECTGTAITQYNVRMDAEVDVKIGRPHLHDSDEAGVRLHGVLNKIKKHARSRPNEAPLAIVQATLANVQEEEVIIWMPQRQTLLWNINRTRPRLPRNLAELTITSPYNRTLTGTQFLQFDSGPGDER